MQSLEEAVHGKGNSQLKATANKVAKPHRATVAATRRFILTVGTVIVKSAMNAKMDNFERHRIAIARILLT